MARKKAVANIEDALVMTFSPDKLVDDKPVPRVTTSIPGLDRILGDRNGNIGMPLSSVYEVYGAPGTGKSSLSLFLSAKVEPAGCVVVIDLENATLEPSYLRSLLSVAGFTGTLRVLSLFDKKGELLLQEDVIQGAVDLLAEEATSCILDSVGMMATVSETSGALTDANVGRRAKVIANATRRLLNRLRERDKAFFFVNHQHAYIGGMGYYTTGGDTMKYGSGVRLRVAMKESDLPLRGMLSEIIVTKLRHGGTSKESRTLMCLIPGFGISPQLSVMFDAISQGKATRESYVKVDGKAVGRIGDLFDLAVNGEVAKFEPFYEVMEYVTV